MCDSGVKAHQRKDVCLKTICFQVVGKHFADLGTEAVLDLPAGVIKDLLPHLTVCQLDELQPALNQRGISTISGWVGILSAICGPNHVIDLQTEEEAKHKVMKMLFTAILYGFTSPFIEENATNLNTPAFLCAAAKCIRQFSLIMSSLRPLQGLTTEQQPLLNLLETCISSVALTQCIDLAKKKTQTPLYILHRLLDHGVAKDLVVHAPRPIMLAWLLHGRGSEYKNPELNKLMYSKKSKSVSSSASAGCSAGCENRKSEDQDDATPCKIPKLDFVPVDEEDESSKANFSVNPHFLCRMFALCDGPPVETCPWGQIRCLEIRQCGSDCLKVLNAALPTFFSLRSLTLHSFSIFSNLDVLDLARALKQLTDSPHSSLTHLSVSVLPYTELMEILLDARSITSLYVEVQTLPWGQHSLHHPRSNDTVISELPLQRLTVKVDEFQTDLNFIMFVLRRSPHLTSLLVSGTRLPTGSSQSKLFATVSESNRLMRSLTLEDMKLSDCLPDILNLLRDCKLEELRFNDCRLLEKWSDKEKSLQQLVSALKAVPSLRTLSLAQNRLAKNVCVLAELFSGSSSSSVKRLDISSNFIQPAEMLEFARRLKANRPPHPLTLDLRKNPGDRDPDTWKAAMQELRPFCVILVEGWISTNTMADHISNM